LVSRSIYLIALLGFALASTAGGLFNQFESVLIARALQGFCSGLMIPLSLGLIFSYQVNNGEVQQDYGVP
jgi:MFS family permease